MIIRIKHYRRFTVIPSELVEDENLDWRSLGLLTYLLSKPDTWEVSPAHLTKCRGSGRDAIYTALAKICKAGYAERKPNPKGGWDWTIYDFKPNPEIPYPEIPYPENQDALVSTDLLVNTDTTIGRFDDFWAVYPRKLKKKASRTAWQRKKLDRYADQIIADVKNRLDRHRPWKEGFIPHPTTYLNGELWEDEIEVKDPVRRNNIIAPAPDDHKGIEQLGKTLKIPPKRDEDYFNYRKRLIDAQRVNA